MNFSKCYILIVVAMLCAGAVRAQSVDSLSLKPQRSAEDIAEYQTFMLRSDLGLTDEQAAAVYDINLKYAQLGRPQSRQQADERRKQKLSDLQAILTEQQYQLFVSKTSEIKHSRGGRKLMPMSTDSVSKIVESQP